MHVQIYTMQSADEAEAIANLGVDHIGITPSDIGLPGEIDIETAQAIMARVKGKATVVALTVDSNLDAIVAMTQAVKPDILHLCGLEGDLPPDGVKELRSRLPGIPIMQAISVAGTEAVDTALTYADVCEYLILDTQAPDIAGIGASGKTHDWNVSRAIVESVDIPVILAGGLSPENVAEAINKVRPWGVDSLTHTNEILSDSGFRKDIERVSAFVTAAKATA